MIYLPTDHSDLALISFYLIGFYWIDFIHFYNLKDKKPF